MIHLDHAAASILHPDAKRKILEITQAESELGSYVVQNRYELELEKVKSNLALFLGAETGSFHFFSSAREAWNSVVSNQAGLIAVDQNEYLGNVPFLKKYVSVNLLKGEDWPANTQLLTVNWAPNNRNHLLDVKSICKKAREQGVLTLIDATQVLGLLPIHINEIDCDYLVATSRKYLRGPRGVGFLYSKRNSTNPIASDFSLSLRLGFGTALLAASKINLHAASERVFQICKEIKNVLPQDWIVSPSHRYVLLEHPTLSAADLALHFSKFGLNVGRYRRADLKSYETDLTEWVRISPHFTMTDEEVSLAINKIKEAANES